MGNAGEKSAVLNAEGKMLTSRSPTLLSSRRLRLIALVGAAFLMGAVTWAVFGAVKASSNEPRVVHLSDGSVLSVGGTATNGFAPELDCNPADLCRPASSSPSSVAGGFERYLLVGTVKPGAENAGVFGFRIGEGASALAYLGCVKLAGATSYACDPAGRRTAPGEIGVYVHE